MSNIAQYQPNQCNATRINRDSKGFKMLETVLINAGASKYECLIAMGKTGSKQELRGHYCTYFQAYRNNGLLTLNETTNNYHITHLGRVLYLEALKR
jgi:hypothetical protein